MAYSRKRSMKKYGGKHRHSNTCKHTRMNGGKHRHSNTCKHTRMNGGKHRHSNTCKHTRSKYMLMNGGNHMLSPAPFSLGGPMDINESSNSIYNAQKYGSNVISKSNLIGGRKRSKSRARRNKRGGIGYGFLPAGSDLNANNSSMANVAPYEIYQEVS